jgi:hypothetical protein
MADSGELLREAAKVYEIPPAALAKHVMAESEKCTQEDADWLVSHFLSGKGTPVVVAMAVIRCIVDLKRQPH